MQLIDIGDLALQGESGTLQQQLFHAIQKKIVAGLWPQGGRLPSTRKLAQVLSVSRNTVIAAYEQLLAEGYIDSRRGSGFYVTIELPEHYLSARIQPSQVAVPGAAMKINQPFAPGVPDLAQFPYLQWQRLLQRHSSRISLMGNQDIRGSEVLRAALSDYLATSRSVCCDPQRIIITSGAQQALSIAVMMIRAQCQHRPAEVLMEQPGYAQMSKVLQLYSCLPHPVAVHERCGLDLAAVVRSDADALYITPSNQYPMGTTLNSEQRVKLIDWAVAGGRWIIEDDYDSEFQFAHKPYTSLQGLAAQMGQDHRVIYIGSFSKVMFNGLRLGYMVVPESQVGQCLMIKDALSGDTPAHTQAALADFIREGHLLRHIRKMRRLYKTKHAQMLAAIEMHLGDRVEVISQAAGLHVTLKWQQGIDELAWVERAAQQGLIIRPLHYYERSISPAGAATHRRDWQGVVLGFGNIALEQIEPAIGRLAQLFTAR